METSPHRCFPFLAARLLLPARRSLGEGGSAATAPRIFVPNKATSPLKTRVGGSRGCPSGRSSRKPHRSREIAMGCGRYGYKTVLGRSSWLNRDPIGERSADGPNMYAFVRNNPANRIDVDGKQSWGPPFSRRRNHRRKASWIAPAGLRTKSADSLPLAQETRRVAGITVWQVAASRVNVLADGSARGLLETGIKTRGGELRLRIATPATARRIRWAGMPAKRRSLARSRATTRLTTAVSIRQ